MDKKGDKANQLLEKWELYDIFALIYLGWMKPFKS